MTRPARGRGARWLAAALAILMVRARLVSEQAHSTLALRNLQPELARALELVLQLAAPLDDLLVGTLRLLQLPGAQQHTTNQSGER